MRDYWIPEKHSLRWWNRQFYHNPDYIVYRGYVVRFDNNDYRLTKFAPDPQNHWKVVPMFLEHRHSCPECCIGFSLLRNLKNGVYAIMVMRKRDLSRLGIYYPDENPKRMIPWYPSIYANKLVYQRDDHQYGFSEKYNIAEVSLMPMSHGIHSHVAAPYQMERYELEKVSKDV